MPANEPFEPFDGATVQMEFQYQARIAHALEYIAAHIGSTQPQETDKGATLAKKLVTGNETVMSAAGAQAASRSRP
jgi:hypothetical protein